MSYGNKRDYRKIDIYRDGVYVCSTTWAKTCREAREHFVYGRTAEHAGHIITARFAERLVEI